jgi:hypothetical protein
VRALKWANTNCFDRNLSFIFDQSDDTTRKRDVLAVYDAFRRHGEEIKLGGVSFLNSREALHLQVADMFAWEFNRNAHKILEKGSETASTDVYMELGKGIKWMDAQNCKKRRHYQDERFRDESTLFRNVGRNGKLF